MIYEYYTDGACTLTKTDAGYDKGPGGWAFALVKDDKVLFSQSLPLMHTTNNEAELCAIYRALLHYVTHFYSEETCDKIKIYSDSAYCVNIYTQWAKNWENNSVPWTRGKKHEPIENLSIIKMTWELLKKLNEGFREVEFVKVIGHSGNKFNEVVDKLAVEAKLAAMGIQEKKDFFKNDFYYAPYTDENSLGSPKFFAMIKKIQGKRAEVSVLDDFGPSKETVDIKED